MMGSRTARLSMSAAFALAVPIGGTVVLSGAGPASATTKTITCTKATGTEARWEDPT